MKLSICIPVFFGAKTIEKLVIEIKNRLNDYQLEVIIVNDGSKDDSDKICINLAEKYSFVKYISLRKNFGEHNAVLCGLGYVTGDYVAIIDDDFQNPPSEIIKLVGKAKENNYDVVYSRYKKN